MRQPPVHLSPSQFETTQSNVGQSITIQDFHPSEPMPLAHPQTGRFSVRGYWVPGTLDRVILQRLDSPVRLEVHYNRVHQLFGRGAMDPLYLTGKSCFDCTLEEWGALKA